MGKVISNVRIIRKHMGRRRAILTDTERELLETNKNSERYYQTVSRVRRKIQEELSTDVDILLNEHPKLFSELKDIVCSKDVDPQWLRDELEAKHEQVESIIDRGTPKIMRLDNGHKGLWIRVNTGSDYGLLINNIEEVGEYLHSKGYNVKAVYHREQDPDVGSPHYEGHIYAQPVEIGQPAHPTNEMRSLSDSKKREWSASS